MGADRYKQRQKYARISEMTRKKGGALLLLEGRRPNKLDSNGAGAMGSGIGGGGGRLRSNHDGTRARRRNGGVGGGVGR